MTQEKAAGELDGPRPMLAGVLGGAIVLAVLAVLACEAAGDGTASLGQEALDLTATASPRDASAFTVRSPIRVRGSFSKPSVSLDKAPVVARVGAAVALALVNPIAAVLPFIDPGASDDAERDAAACAALVQSGNPAKVAPAEAGRAAAVATLRR
jgi:hypothetical protein